MFLCELPLFNDKIIFFTWGVVNHRAFLMGIEICGSRRQIKCYVKK